MSRAVFRIPSGANRRAPSFQKPALFAAPGEARDEADLLGETDLRWILLSVALIANPALAQQTQRAREKVLSNRLFIFQAVTTCPNDVGAERVRGLIDRTSQEILRISPGTRGEGIIQGVGNSWIMLLTTVFQKGGGSAVCSGPAPEFTYELGRMASE